LPGNKGESCLRNDLARTQQAPGIAENSYSRTTARRLGMANRPSTVRARTEATGCGRSSGESAIETARPLFIAGSLPPISLAPGTSAVCPHVVHAGYEVVGASKDLGMPAIVVAIMRSCRVDRSGIPPFTTMTDRRRPRRRAQPRGLTQGSGVPDLVQLTVLSCLFYGVIPTRRESA